MRDLPEITGKRTGAKWSEERNDTFPTKTKEYWKSRKSAKCYTLSYVVETKRNKTCLSESAKLNRISMPVLIYPLLWSWAKVTEDRMNDRLLWRLEG